MLKRKIEDELASFNAEKPNSAFLLTGARQVGKTYIIREHARRHFKCFLEINFIKQPEAKTLFDGLKDEDDFFLRLSAFTDKVLVQGETLVFFDEVQECPEVVTYIKFLVDDGRYRYAVSGSLLGVELKDIRSAPVGYLREYTMYPLDFEEFLWACGLKAELFSHLRECWEKREPVNRTVHEKLLSFVRLYLVVGGMPAAVQKYLDTKNISSVVSEQRAILVEYRKDAAKYDQKDKLKIERVLELIPEELNKKNKRFVVADLEENGRYERLEENFIWLKEAGIGLAVCSATDPCVPLRLSRDSAFFKLYLNDVGLLASMYLDGVQLKVLTGETDVNFGGIYENFVVQELCAHGFKPYFFNSRKIGEVDFLIERDSRVEPIEVKSGRHYKAHAALDNLMSNRDYGLDHAIVFSNSNCAREGRVDYLPVYFVMFLKKDSLPENLIYELP